MKRGVVRRLPVIAESPAEHELLTVPQFASRINRNPQSVWRWIRNQDMPSNSVVMIHGVLYIDWTVYKTQAVKVVF